MAHRCLLVKTLDLALNDLIWGITEAGHNCDCVALDCNMLDFDQKELEALEAYLKDSPVDIVLTMNFSPTVSCACFNLDIPYAAWIYDSPLQSLYHPQAMNNTNHFFIFDKHLLETQKKRGLPNLHYLPLAANSTRMGQMKISPDDEKNYFCNISFVGMQYVDGRYAYFRNHLEQPFQDELNSIAYGMIGRWDNGDHIHNKMSDKLINAMLALIDSKPEDAINMPDRTYFEEVVIARAVAYTERRLMMEAVSDLNPRWYGADANEDAKIPGVEYRPRLYYEDTLPKAYNLSKINLSSCLHSISSGIPLRVFDIMGAGGFILTNYQPEILELFEVGKEIVVYHNFDEMRELCKYFLSHEDQRMSILLAGYERILKEYNYRVAADKILSIVL